MSAQPQNLNVAMFHTMMVACTQTKSTTMIKVARSMSLGMRA
ncbi:hypothetical protein [Shigella sp. FC2125]|nr:hypothetical protein [Shigella sp. FC2125]